MKMEGWTESSPPPLLGDLVNEALRVWSWEAEYVTAQTTFSSVIGQAEYTLPNPPDWKIIKDVTFGSKFLDRESEDEVRVRNPLWLLANNGQPDSFFVIRNNVVRLYPPPGMDETCIAYGIRADTDLVVSTDTPACPAHYHRAICHLAAWMYADAYSLGEGTNRVERYYEKALAQARDCQLWMASQNQMGLQRTVLRRQPERLLMIATDTNVHSV